ncbi:MAG: hypothetical protein JNN15_05555 [Blastocatellia bacterium]|nr:hypothetical protein [Blastocatellia bacterium]
MEEWTDKVASEIAEKIALKQRAERLGERSGRIVKLAEKARSEGSADLLQLFSQKIDALCSKIDNVDGKSFWQRFFSKKRDSVLTYNVTHDVTFRFQLRDACGSRMEIDYNLGFKPALVIDIALAESIEGQYLPIFRESGAIAGAQIWRLHRTDKKHPELVARLFLVMSITALEEGLAVKDSVRWLYEEGSRPFTAKSVEELITALTA